MAGGKGGVAPGGSELDELKGAVATFCERPDQHPSPAQLGQEQVELRHVGDRLELEFSVGAACFAATEEYEDQGSVSPIDWIRHACKMSGHTAAERVCVGEEAERLPLSFEAVTDGQIGFAHLALMARPSSALHQSRTTQDFDEPGLLARATELSVGRFRWVCHHARHAGDPEGYAEGEVRGAEDRVLELKTAEDGFVYINGLLDSAGGGVLRTALEPLALKSGAGDDRHHDRSLADAL